MISLLKFTRGKEVINRLELSAVAEMIRRNPDEQRVRNLRLQYQFMKPERLDDGQIAVDSRHVLDMPTIDSCSPRSTSTSKVSERCWYTTDW